MDNLFNLCKLYPAVCLAETLCHGVCRLSNTGIPPEVVQKQKQNPRLAAKICGLTRAERLIHDDGCPNHLAASVYNQPVTVVSMIFELITWNVRTRKVYSHSTCRNVDMDYLRLDIIGNYNNNMNSVDLADQMCHCYCFDHFFRNQKW